MIQTYNIKHESPQDEPNLGIIFLYNLGLLVQNGHLARYDDIQVVPNLGKSLNKRWSVNDRERLIY